MGWREGGSKRGNEEWREREREGGRVSTLGTIIKTFGTKKNY